MELHQKAVELGLHSDIGIEAKVQNLMHFTGVDVWETCNEFGDYFEKVLMPSYSGTAPSVYEHEIKRIIAAAARLKGETNPDHEKLLDIFYEKLLGEKIDRPFVFTYFGVPEDGIYTGQDILDIRLFPHGCTSFCILAQDFLADAGISSQIKDLSYNGGNVGHSVLKYKIEDGSWRRCDPKWQERRDDKGRIFFRHHPELEQEFVHGRRPFLHGGHYHEENGVIVYNEYHKQETLRERLSTSDP